jgi:hypothetical protein
MPASMRVFLFLEKESANAKLPGHWIDPQTGQHWRVSRHEDWAKSSAIYRGYEFSPEIEKEIQQTEDEDELRIIGVKAGLIRTRLHINGHLSIQVWADPARVDSLLHSVVRFCQETEVLPNQDLKIDNLGTGDTVVLTLEELGIKLKNGKNVFGD